MSKTIERVKALRAEMDAANIPKDKQALILGQFKKESGNFAFLSELGGKNYFKKYDIAHNPSKAKELGNTEPGDGYKYKGRGFVQLTGKANYAKYSQMVFGDDRLVTNPELLERPDVASKVSLAYVEDRAKGFETADDLTRAINPGLFSKNVSPAKRAKYDADIKARQDNSEIFKKQFTLENQDDSFVVDGDWGKNSKQKWSQYERASSDANVARAEFAQTDPRRVDTPAPAPEPETYTPMRNYAAEDLVYNSPRMIQPIRPLERTYEYNTMEDLLMDKGLMNPLLK